MKLIRNIVAAAAIASVATSASAAVVEFTWTGTGGYTATGSIDVTKTLEADGVFTTGTLLSYGYTNGVDTQTGVMPGTIAFSFTFSNSGTTAVLTTGSAFSVSDLNGDFLLTFAAPDWDLDGGTATATGEAAMDLTVVPEPETYAAVAGAGLVAFGLFRRRATKA
jgi:hypothetical protein